MKNFTDELRAVRDKMRDTTLELERDLTPDEKGHLAAEFGLVTKTDASRADWHVEHARRLAADESYAGAVARVRETFRLPGGYLMPDHDARITHELRMAFEPAYAEEDARLRIAVDERRARRPARDRLRKRGIPEKNLDMVLDVARLQETAALRHVVAFAGTSKTILVLSGPPGVGKTMAMSWALSTDLPRSQRMVTAAQLSRLDRYDQNVMSGILSCAALGIDDLGSQYVDKSGFFMALLDEVINERYASRRRTVITTNLNLDKFTDHYGSRVIDRIREVGTFAHLPGASMRGSKP